MRALAQLLMVQILLVFGLAIATAQTGAALTGIVADSSGAVLPGVMVEARSPALIEQLRSAVTDESGRYRIVDLRPGTYTVTFALPGFTTVTREGIELSGTFIATVNVELRVGSLQETVTVTGESPIVDTQSTKTQETLQGDVIGSIPTGRQYYSLTTLVPALNVQGNDVGGILGPDLQRLSSSRRTPQRRSGPDRRLEHGLSGDGCLVLCTGCRDGPGSQLYRRRRHGRSDNWRPGHEYHAQGR
ncbi:MAG TPA: carboxypeptidase-like regulatory domain-containing protein, partial [Terriglobia bacterium]|nr:carboxypeptidase-like regulatory domain-containing protein [Terriglobia bacterium]